MQSDRKTLFWRLAVFRGCWTLEAAETICTISNDPSAGSGQVLDVLNALESLVDKNLVTQSDIQGEPRFMMLETIREYALERLTESSEEDAIRRQHAQFFLALAEEAESKLYGETRAWLERLGQEHDNLRAALAWSIYNAIDIGLRLAGTLGRFWHLRGEHVEGRDWLTKALAKKESSGTDVAHFRAKALYQASMLAGYQMDEVAALSLGEKSVALWRELDDTHGLAYALRELAVAEFKQGDYTKARSLVEESIALFRQTEDKTGLALVLQLQGFVMHLECDYEKARLSIEESITIAHGIGDINSIAGATSTLGRIAFDQGDYAAARSLIKKSLKLFRQTEDKPGVAWNLCWLGNLSYTQGDYGRARIYYKESLEFYQEIGYVFWIAWLLSCLGHVSLHQNSWQEAQAHFTESLVLHRESWDKGSVALCLIGLAEVAERQEQAERAAQLLGAVKMLQETLNSYLLTLDRHGPAIVQTEYDRIVAAVRSTLGEETFEAAHAKGREMKLDELIAYALATCQKDKNE